MTHPTNIQAVLFDRDDTLSLNDREAWGRAARWLRERYGLDSREAARQMQAQWAGVEGQWQHLRTLADEEDFWRDYGAQLAGRLGLPEGEGARIVQAWPYQRFLMPAPGVREVLTQLRARGLKIGVLSNTLPNVAVTLEAVELADVVDVAISTCALGVHKPEPRAFTLAAKLLEVAPEEVLFVDDRPENVAAARGVGMGALLIDHAGQLPEAIHHLTGVLDHLGGLP